MAVAKVLCYDSNQEDSRDPGEAPGKLLLACGILPLPDEELPHSMQAGNLSRQS